MSDITYLEGDATSPETDGNKIICHICNNKGGWGRGFVLAISNKWFHPENDYRRWANTEDGSFKLGNIQIVQVKDDLHIANMIGQDGISSPTLTMPIRYEAVKECLIKVVDKARELGASVHMPRIGCGLAGGKWEEIEPLIRDTLIEANIDVYVYDLT